MKGLLTIFLGANLTNFPMYDSSSY